MELLQGASRVCVCVCVVACVWALSCATLCNIFFVICFLFVCLFFGVTRQRRLVFVLVACHTHTHTHKHASCCVGFVAECVCVRSRKCYIVFGTQGDTAVLSLTPTLRLALKSTLTRSHTHTHSHTLAYQSVEKKRKKSIWRCHPWVAGVAVATFVVILWQHL